MNLISGDHNQVREFQTRFLSVMRLRKLTSMSRFYDK
jgi:hypothetical protein